MISENEVLKNFIDKLLQIDRLGAEKIFKAVQQQGTALQTIDKLIVPALEELGKGWDAGTVALAQVYMSSKICEELAGCFLSFSSLEGAEQPRMAIALLEDYHALGKMIIHASLRAVGYELHDYGRLTALELAQKVCEDSVEIILISTLMLRSALQVKKVKQLLADAGSPARIIVGGAPFRIDPLLWKEVGADAMGRNAAEAIKAVSSYMKTEETI